MPVLYIGGYLVARLDTYEPILSAAPHARLGEFGSIETHFGSPMLDHRLDMDGTAAKSSGRLGEFGSIETLFGGSPMLDHRLDLHGPAAKSSGRRGRFSVRCSAGSTWTAQRQSQAVDEVNSARSRPFLAVLCSTIGSTCTGQRQSQAVD